MENKDCSKGSGLIKSCTFVPISSQVHRVLEDGTYEIELCDDSDKDGWTIDNETGETKTITREEINEKYNFIKDL